MGAALSLVNASGVPFKPPTRIDPFALVRDAGGVPQPPADVVRRLKQWEPALGLKYINVQWALTWTWKENDSRRQWIREGKWSEQDAYDIIGYVPLDCALDEVPAYAQRALKCYPRDEVRRLADFVGLYNAETVPKEHVAQVLNDTLGSQQFAADVTANSSQVNVPDAVTPEPPVLSKRAQKRQAKQAKQAKPEATP